MTALAWLGLAVAGLAAQAAWTDAGNQVRYEHLFPFAELLVGWRTLAGVALAGQAVAVAIGVSRKRPAIRAWTWVALAVVPFTAAPASRDLGFFAYDAGISAFLQLVQLANWYLLAAALADDWVRRMERLVLRMPVGALAAWAGIGAAALGFFAYERFPHVPDEVGYVYHAQYFAEGLLTMDAPPAPEAFDLDLMMIERGRWWVPMPPGWPAILTLGVWAGAAWLVNPLLTALNVWLVAPIFRRFLAESTARLALLLFAASPWVVMTGLGFMVHTSHLTLLLLAANALLMVECGRGFAWAALAGVALGGAFFVRPLDSALAAVLLGLWALWGDWPRWRVGPAVALTVVTSAVALGNLPYNTAITGDAWTFPVNHYFDTVYGEGCNDLGFGPDRGVGWPLDPFPGHAPKDAIVNAQLNGAMVGRELLGWGVPAWLLVLGGVLGSRAQVRWGAAAWGAAIVGGLSLYWFSGGPDFGARYWFALVPALVMLAALGLEALAGAEAARLRAVALLACLAASCVYLPWRGADKYFRFRDMQPALDRIAAAESFGAEDLVFVRGERYPHYMAAAVRNSVPLGEDGPVYAWATDSEVRARVGAAFAGRRVWVLEGLTGGGYRVAERPQE